jgi:D-sedoheptulose 7-phosphate isomerase
MNDFKDRAVSSLKETLKISENIAKNHLDVLSKITDIIIEAIKNGNKIIVFGNGGSAADSQHMVAELVGRFKKERRPIEAVCLNVNTSTMTSIANDYGYAKVFSRQLEAIGKEQDVAIGISTSGTSENVLTALKKAKKKGLKTIGLTGKNGHKMAEFCNECLFIPSDKTDKIQEAHIACIHIICDAVESSLS